MMKPIPILELLTPVPPLIYCGCDKRSGHFFFGPGMNSISVYNTNPSLLKLDTGFAPQDTQDEGAASTFLIFGDKCFNDALAECRAAFPQVFARFKFEVTLRRNMFV